MAAPGEETAETAACPAIKERTEKVFCDFLQVFGFLLLDGI